MSSSINASETFMKGIANLGALSQPLQVELNHLKSGLITNADGAIKEAEVFVKGLNVLKEQFLNINESDFLESLTKKNIVLFDFVSNFLGFFNNEFTKFSPELKKSLIQVTSISMDFFVFHSCVTNHFPGDDSLNDLYEGVKKSLNDRDIKTPELMHEIRCMKSGLRALKNKTHADKRQVQQDVPLAILSIAHYGAEATISTLTTGVPKLPNKEDLRPSAKLCASAYEYFKCKKEAKTYPDVWAFRWCVPQNLIRTTADFSFISPFFSKYMESKKVAFCAVRCFGSIIHNAEAESGLKKHVFEESTPSILTLAKYKKMANRRTESVEIRSGALSHLKFLAQFSDYSVASIQAIIGRAIKDSQIRGNAYDALLEIYNGNPEKYKEAVQQNDFKSRKTQKLEKKLSELKADKEAKQTAFSNNKSEEDFKELNEEIEGIEKILNFIKKD